MFSPNSFLQKLQEKLETAAYKEKVTYDTILNVYKKFCNFFQDCGKISKEQVPLLAHCCLQYVNCLQKFVDDLLVYDRTLIESLKDCMSIVDESSELDIPKNDYLVCIAVPIFEKIAEPGIKIWFAHKLLECFNLVVRNTRKDVRHSIVGNHQLQLCKLADIICTCGDYNYQAMLLETIFRLCSKVQINEIANKLFPKSNDFIAEICNIDEDHFDRDARIFLNKVNSQLKQVLSLQCEVVRLDKVKVNAPKDEEDELPLWVDFNKGTQTITVMCDKESLQTEPSLEVSENDDYELITIDVRDIDNVIMSRFLQPDSAYSVGLLFIFYMTTPCSVKFSTSEEARHATELKLAIFNCPELKELIGEILPEWFGRKFTGLGVQSVNAVNTVAYDSRFIMSNNCQLPETKAQNEQTWDMSMASLFSETGENFLQEASEGQQSPSSRSATSDVTLLKNKSNKSETEEFIRKVEKDRVSQIPIICDVEELQKQAANSKFVAVAGMQEENQNCYEKEETRLLVSETPLLNSSPDLFKDTQTVESTDLNYCAEVEVSKCFLIGEDEKTIIKVKWPRPSKMSKGSVGRKNENLSVSGDCDSSDEISKLSTRKIGTIKRKRRKKSSRIKQRKMSTKVEVKSKEAEMSVGTESAPQEQPSTLQILISGELVDDLNTDILESQSTESTEQKRHRIDDVSELNTNGLEQGVRTEKYNNLPVKVAITDVEQTLEPEKSTELEIIVLSSDKEDYQPRLEKSNVKNKCQEPEKIIEIKDKEASGDVVESSQLEETMKLTRNLEQKNVVEVYPKDGSRHPTKDNNKSSCSIEQKITSEMIKSKKRSRPYTKKSILTKKKQKYTALSKTYDDQDKQDTNIEQPLIRESSYGNEANQSEEIKTSSHTNAASKSVCKSEIRNKNYAGDDIRRSLNEEKNKKDEHAEKQLIKDTLYNNEIYQKKRKKGKISRKSFKEKSKGKYNGTSKRGKESEDKKLIKKNQETSAKAAEEDNYTIADKVQAINSDAHLKETLNQAKSNSDDHFSGHNVEADVQQKQLTDGDAVVNLQLNKNQVNEDDEIVEKANQKSSNKQVYLEKFLNNDKLGTKMYQDKADATNNNKQMVGCDSDVEIFNKDNTQNQVNEHDVDIETAFDSLLNDYKTSQSNRISDKKTAHNSEKLLTETEASEKSTENEVKHIEKQITAVGGIEVINNEISLKQDQQTINEQCMKENQKDNEDHSKGCRVLDVTVIKEASKKVCSKKSSSKNKWSRKITKDNCKQASMQTKTEVADKKDFLKQDDEKINKQNANEYETAVTDNLKIQDMLSEPSGIETSSKELAKSVTSDLKTNYEQKAEESPDSHLFGSQEVILDETSGEFIILKRLCLKAENLEMKTKIFDEVTSSNEAVKENKLSDEDMLQITQKHRDEAKALAAAEICIKKPLKETRLNRNKISPRNLEIKPAEGISQNGSSQEFIKACKLTRNSKMLRKKQKDEMGAEEATIPEKSKPGQIQKKVEMKMSKSRLRSKCIEKVTERAKSESNLIKGTEPLLQSTIKQDGARVIHHSEKQKVLRLPDSFAHEQGVDKKAKRSREESEIISVHEKVHSERDNVKIAKGCQSDYEKKQEKQLCNDQYNILTEETVQSDTDITNTNKSKDQLLVHDLEFHGKNSEYLLNSSDYELQEEQKQKSTKDNTVVNKIFHLRTNDTESVEEQCVPESHQSDIDKLKCLPDGYDSTSQKIDPEHNVVQEEEISPADEGQKVSILKQLENESKKNTIPETFKVAKNKTDNCQNETSKKIIELTDQKLTTKQVNDDLGTVKNKSNKRKLYNVNDISYFDAVNHSARVHHNEKEFCRNNIQSVEISPNRNMQKQKTGDTLTALDVELSTNQQSEINPVENIQNHNASALTSDTPTTSTKMPSSAKNLDDPKQKPNEPNQSGFSNPKEKILESHQKDIECLGPGECRKQHGKLIQHGSKNRSAVVERQQPKRRCTSKQVQQPVPNNRLESLNYTQMGLKSPGCLERVMNFELLMKSLETTRKQYCEMINGRKRRNSYKTACNGDVRLSSEDKWSKRQKLKETKKGPNTFCYKKLPLQKSRWRANANVRKRMSKPSIITPSNKEDEVPFIDLITDEVPFIDLTADEDQEKNTVNAQVENSSTIKIQTGCQCNTNIGKRVNVRRARTSSEENEIPVIDLTLDQDLCLEEPKESGRLQDKVEIQVKLDEIRKQLHTVKRIISNVNRDVNNLRKMWSK